ncbi:MAG: hypothetical protein QXM22_02825 [Candidatus Bathyarchaeia archaeon]
MKIRENLIATVLLGLLLMTLALPLTTATVQAEQQQYQEATWRTEGNWTYIQNDVITVAFPAGGKKPMFLWWYTKNPDNINVVKYKGLIEYISYDQPYFLLKAQAEPWRIRQRIQALFYEPRRHMVQDMLRLRAAWQLLSVIGNLTGLHSPFLPFSGSRWELSTPVNVTKGDVKYLAFNFTLVDVPDNRPNFQFAEGNIIIRCRFYYTPATEDVEGQYSYTVEAGEFKMDLVIKHWEWNIDNPYLRNYLQLLEEYLGITIPEGKAGLALWVNMASINMTQLPILEADAQGLSDEGLETAAMTRNMYVEGERVQVTQNMTVQDCQPLPNRLRERFRFRYEKGNATLAGFFKFVPKALLRDPINNTVVDVVDVTASYVAAGGHLRAYICYPYFGNYALEHDPSIGLEALPALTTYGLVIALLGIATVIAIGILATRWKKGAINILKTN